VNVLGTPEPNPAVSILLPVHDAESTLRDCLRSVRRQEFGDWECVLVDDGSRDASPAIAREAARSDPRVRVLTTPHRGLVAALNLGLDDCRGRLVARMDADDLMHRRRLVEQVEQLDSHPSWAGTGCHVRIFPRDGLGTGNRAYEAWVNSIRSPEDVEREAFVECPLVHPTWILRRETLSAYRYQDHGWPEDYDLILRMITGGREIGMLPRRRLAWRHSEDRLSRRSPTYGQDRFTACKARYLARSFLARTERYILWGYGGHRAHAVPGVARARQTSIAHRRTARGSPGESNSGCGGHPSRATRQRATAAAGRLGRGDRPTHGDPRRSGSIRVDRNARLRLCRVISRPASGARFD
jgi:glycosyltransferase involved in cell wall biosynthesis